MTPKLTISQPLPLDSESLRQLARRKGECLTVLLPASRPGAPDGDRLVTLHGLYHASPALADSDLRRKVESALQEDRLRGGGDGLAIFAGEDFLDFYTAPVETAALVADTYSFLLPLLLEATAPQDFFALGLGQKHLRLFHYLHGVCTPVEHPADLPASLEAFRHTDSRGDLNRQGSSASGGSSGGASAVNFGVLSEREDLDLHLERFFARVDAGIAPILGHRLLLLMGVEDEVAAFRRAAKHCHLFAEQISHNVRDASLRDIAQWARECALTRRRAEGREALRKFRERGDRSLAVDQPDAILDAATTGRVHLLCVPEGASPHAALVNAAAAETLSHGGEVFTVPMEALSPSRPMVAILRY